MPFAAAGAIGLGAATAAGATAGTAALIGAGAAAAGGIASNLMRKGEVSQGQDQANAAQQGFYDQARTDLLPFITSGQNALAPVSSISGPTPWSVGGATDVGGQLSGIYGPDQATAAMANFRTDPGYQFRFDEGVRAVDANAAASGMLRSGATGKALEKFGQGLADQGFQTYLSNANTGFTNYYNRLMDLSKLGENAAAGVGNAGVTTGQGIAGTDTSAAAAQSKLTGDTASGLGTTVTGLANNPAVQKGINSLFGPSNASYNPAGGLGSTLSVSPGYGDTLFQSGGVF